MTTESERRRDRSQADDLRVPGGTAPRRWYRRRSRLEKVLQRNALWAAEARTTPPLYLQDDAA